MIQIHEFFQSLARTNMLFWFQKGWPQLFLIWLFCWKLIWKIVLCWGNYCQLTRQFHYYPNQLNLPRQLKTANIHKTMAANSLISVNIGLWKKTHKSWFFMSMFNKIIPVSIALPYQTQRNEKLLIYKHVLVFDFWKSMGSPWIWIVQNQWWTIVQKVRRHFLVKVGEKIEG